MPTNALEHKRCHPNYAFSHAIFSQCQIWDVPLVATTNLVLNALDLNGKDVLDNARIKPRPNMSELLNGTRTIRPEIVKSFEELIGVNPWAYAPSDFKIREFVHTLRPTAYQPNRNNKDFLKLFQKWNIPLMISFRFLLRVEGRELTDFCEAIGYTKEAIYCVLKGRITVSDEFRSLFEEHLGANPWEYAPRCFPKDKLQRSEGMLRRNTFRGPFPRTLERPLQA